MSTTPTTTTDLTPGRRYTVRYRLDGQRKDRTLVGQYLGPNTAGGEDFSLRPEAGTTSLPTAAILEATPADADRDRVEASLNELAAAGAEPMDRALAAIVDDETYDAAGRPDASDEVAEAKPRKRTTKASTRKPGTARAGAGDRVTFKDAAERVLRKGDGPMKVKAIAEAAIPLVTPTPTGKTPAATLSAHLVVDANKGGRFVKTAPGTFDVRELNPRGAAKRPAKRAAKK